jgi:DNA-binding NtrC family response regulator
MSHFLTKYNQLHGRSLTGFTQRAVDAMLSYEWPGNVREMENVIERGVILGSDNGPVDSSHLFTSGERFDEKRFEVGREGRLIVSDPAALVSDPEPDRELDRVSRGLAICFLVRAMIVATSPWTKLKPYY